MKIKKLSKKSSDAEGKNPIYGYDETHWVETGPCGPMNLFTGYKCVYGAPDQDCCLGETACG